MNTFNRLLLLAGSMLLLLKPFESTSQIVYSDTKHQKELNKARNNVNNERFDEAIAEYAVLVKDNDNKSVSAEYAYVLALSGCYDGAIMNLDKIIASGQADNEVLFYTSQVLKLMEYDTVADMFLMSGKTSMVFPPSWLLGQYRSFVEKYKYPATINTDDFATALQRANKLAEKHQYIQSLVLFLELIEVYPNEYLPYVGLSALMENLGYKKEAAKYLRIGIKKMGTDKYKIDPYEVFNKHLEKLETDKDSDNLSFQEKKPEVTNNNTRRSFSYLGISYINKMWTVNSKYGLYVNEKTSFSFGFSIYNYDNANSYLFDVALCLGKIFVFGVDLSAQLSGGNFAIGLGPCMGLSIPIGRTSIDILGVFNMYKQEDIGATVSTSVGITHYF